MAKEYNMTEEQLQQAWNSFQGVDNDRSGEIDFNELKALLRVTLGSKMSPNLLDRYVSMEFSGADSKKSGTIGFTEYLRIFAKLSRM